ncbi:hypothetical protein V6N13_109771 [Hibiscus sabdariffa]
MFDLAINTTLDPKNLNLPPKHSPPSPCAPTSHLLRERVFCDFRLIREGVSESFCSLVYSGELRRGQDDSFVETKRFKHSPASHGYGVVPVSIIGIEFHYPVQISSSWLSCKAKLADMVQPLVNDGFQAVILQAVIKEEPLFFPYVLGSNYFVMAFSNCCTAKSGWHAFGG